MDLTVGARKLREFVESGGWSQTALAVELGITQPSVSSWLTGRARPEAHLRAAISMIAGIPAGDWETAEERALVERVRSKHIDPNALADSAALTAAGA